MSAFVTLTLQDICDMMKDAKSFSWRLSYEQGGVLVPVHVHKAENSEAAPVEQLAPRTAGKRPTSSEMEGESLRTLKTFVERVAKRAPATVFVIDYKSHSKATDDKAAGPFRFTADEIGSGAGLGAVQDLSPDRIESLGYVPKGQVDALEQRLIAKLDQAKQQIDYERKLEKLKEKEVKATEAEKKFNDRSAQVANGVGLAVQAFLSGQGLSGLQGLLAGNLGSPQQPSRPQEEQEEQPKSGTPAYRIEKIAEELFDLNPTPRELATLEILLPRAITEMRQTRNHGFETQPGQPAPNNYHPGDGAGFAERPGGQQSADDDSQ